MVLCVVIDHRPNDTSEIDVKREQADHDSALISKSHTSINYPRQQHMRHAGSTYSLKCAGATSLQYTVENTTNQPFANPRKNRPTYSPAADVDPICSATAPQHTTHATHSAALRPKYAPKSPAAIADTQAPRFMRDVMSCCTVDCSAYQLHIDPIRCRKERVDVFPEHSTRTLIP